MTDVVKIPVGRYGDFALVDAADEARLNLSSYRWNGGTGYACNSILGPMHRVILGLVIGEQRFVHHINEDKLDNRRANLQIFDNLSACNGAPHPKRDLISATGKGYAGLA